MDCFEGNGEGSKTWLSLPKNCHLLLCDMYEASMEDSKEIIVYLYAFQLLNPEYNFKGSDFTLSATKTFIYGRDLHVAKERAHYLGFHPDIPSVYNLHHTQ